MNCTICTIALWRGKVQKVQGKKRSILSANFYIGGMACRGMDDVRRKGGVSYPASLADRKHRKKESAALKYRERDEEEKPLGGGTPSGMGGDTI